MRKYLGSIITVILMVGLFGCSKETAEEYETNTVVVDDNGLIVEYIIEEFSTNHYSQDELKGKIENEITNYNNENVKDSISLKEFVVIDEKVKVTLAYASYIDFEKFNQVTFFVGTVEEAIKGEYDLDVTLLAEDESQESIKESEINEMVDKNIIIYNMGINVVVPKKVSYFSENAVLLDNKQVETKEGTINYIIY